MDWRFLSKNLPDTIGYEAKTIESLLLIECAIVIDLYAHIVDSNDLLWLSVF